LTVRSLPDIHLTYMSLLVLLLCLCKSFKELCLRCLEESSSRLAGAKVLLFPEPTKLFCNFFQEKCKKNACLDFGQAGREGGIYLIYIRTHERVALAAQQGSKAGGFAYGESKAGGCACGEAKPGGCAYGEAKPGAVPAGEQSPGAVPAGEQSPGAVPAGKQRQGLCLRRSKAGGFAYGESKGRGCACGGSKAGGFDY